MRYSIQHDNDIWETLVRLSVDKLWDIFVSYVELYNQRASNVKMWRDCLMVRKCVTDISYLTRDELSVPHI